MKTSMSRRRLLGVTLSVAALTVAAPGAEHPASLMAAQEGPETARARAERTLPPDVYVELSELSTAMEADGVPSEPLFAKALEGAAKRVPPDRLVPAVRAHAGRLLQARQALGPAADVPLLMAGADAIRRGVPADVLGSLPRDRPRSPMAVLALTELLESGVPTDRALETLAEAMRQRNADTRILDIPARVRRLVRDGVPPRDAIDRVRRMIRRNRGGMVGPTMPMGDEPLADRRILDWRQGG